MTLLIVPFRTGSCEMKKPIKADLYHKLILILPSFPLALIRILILFNYYIIIYFYLKTFFCSFAQARIMFIMVINLFINICLFNFCFHFNHIAIYSMSWNYVSFQLFYYLYIYTVQHPFALLFHEVMMYSVQLLQDPAGTIYDQFSLLLMKRSDLSQTEIPLVFIRKKKKSP